MYLGIHMPGGVEGSKSSNESNVKVLCSLLLILKFGWISNIYKAQAEATLRFPYPSRP